MATDAISPLLTAEGWQLLASLGPYDDATSLTLASSLRKAGHPAELVAAALTQSRLRSKATAKFGEFAQEMLFTQTGLEQATRLSIAALHAQRFLAAGVHHVADLGSGLGADSLALASLDITVTAVEMDEVTAACATINLTPFPHAKVIHGRAEEFPLDGVNGVDGIDGVWLDPARRTTTSSGTTRLFDPEAFSPPLSFVEELAAQGLAVGVKMGPGIPHEAVPADAEAQWISVNGDVVEVGLYFNSLARPGIKRAALVISPSGRNEITSSEPFVASAQHAEQGPLSGYLYEPDGAVIRAGLVADLARSLGAYMFDPHIAYLGSATALDTPFARGYKILEVLPLNVKALKNWVKTNGISVLDIKKRGVSVTPEELRKQLLAGVKHTGKKGAKKATLILTRIGDDRVAAVVDPL